MRKLKTIFKLWTQERVKMLNASFAEQLRKMFDYSCQVERLKNCAINSKETGISNEKYGDHEIVVSLTTYGKRLYEVYLAIESIMQQTLKPNRIVLWLSDELKNSNIPLVLQRQQKRGLEIKYCKDIGPYTKLIPALQAFPSDSIITIDDDIFYNFDLIENLVNEHKTNPKIIYCARMHRMQLTSSSQLKKYEQWTWLYKNTDISPLNFPTGTGGIIYPPHCFNEEVFNEDVFMDICKYADDVWFKAMALLNGVMARRIESNQIYFTNKNVQDVSLNHINNGRQKMNDIQLKAVFDKYSLYDKLIATK